MRLKGLLAAYNKSKLDSISLECLGITNFKRIFVIKISKIKPYMGLFTSSIARKVTMSLSGLFLVLFLGQHLFINLMSVFSPDTFNELSHFMGANGLIQFVMQPILIIGVLLHFITGFILEAQNRKARPIKYGEFAGNSNSTWVSRNMLVSGLVILAFLAVHMYDFFFPEIAHKYIYMLPSDPERYHPETVAKFADPIRTFGYIISFVLLAMHLWHGFSSSFQSIGFSNKYSRALKGFTQLYAVVVPLGFIFIALYHFLNPLN